MRIEPLCAKVNNRVRWLGDRLFAVSDVEFLDYSSPSGKRTYCRTLFLILAKAVNDLCPEAKVVVCNSLPTGFFCYISYPGVNVDIKKVCAGDIDRRMREIVEADLEITRQTVPTEEAAEKFMRLGMPSKVKLLKSTGKLYTPIHELDGYADYFYGALLPRTGFAKWFTLSEYEEGLLLTMPTALSDEGQNENPAADADKQKAAALLHATYKEYHAFQNLIGLRAIGDINEAVEEGYSTDLINISEAIQEKQIVNIAQRIASNDDIKFVLIAGPSSSGKTSTCKRVSLQLTVNGKMPLMISLDDYFVDRDKTPLQPNGDYDFESIYTLNLDLFNEHLDKLLRGEEITLPHYNFITGKSETSDTRVQMKANNVLVIEGIHALNPMLTSKIADKHIFRLYASALTSVLLDDHNYIPTTDNRLLRRIIRDAKTRGCDARETIRRWPSVREGEDKWIFPFQGNADAVFNTAMIFELAALKAQGEQLLRRVPENCDEYSEAYRLLKFLQFIADVPEKNIPPTSLLREFLGGSSFTY